MFRLSGTYQLPWGVMYGSSLGMQSGDYFFREVQIRDANNVNVAIRVEPQADRYAWTKLWDNRISKRFKTFGNQSLEGQFDLFNTLNTNTITAPDQPQRLDLPAADGHHRRARLQARRQVSLLDPEGLGPWGLEGLTSSPQVLRLRRGYGGQASPYYTAGGSLSRS